MAKHRAETGKSASTRGPKQGKPQHRRIRERRSRRNYVAVVPVATLALVAGASAATALTHDGSKPVNLDNAANSWTAKAAVMASRQDLLSSRSGSRVLLGADRLDAIQTMAKKTVHEIKVREAERLAREQAAREAAEERRQERIEARQWGVPVASYEITATFGETSSLWSSIHTGVDLNAVTGTPVTSVGPGTVTFAGYDGSYGNKIVVEHADGMETWYCHLSAINVGVGQAVDHTTVIGLVGATGNVTGDHLHLELRPAGGGDPIDPVPNLLASHGIQF